MNKKDQDKGPQAVKEQAQDKSAEQKRIAELEEALKEKDEELAFADSQYDDLKAVAERRIGDRLELEMRGDVREQKLALVQFADKFSFGGIESAGKGWRHRPFYVREGDIVRMPVLLVERIKRDYPELLIRDEKKFKAQTVLTTATGKNGRREVQTMDCEPKDMIEAASTVGLPSAR